MTRRLLNFATLTAVGVLAAAAAGSARAAEMAEIYKLLPNTALSGVVSPEMPDRTDVKKAWPHPPADLSNIQVGWTDISMGNTWFVEEVKVAKSDGAKVGMTVDVQIAEGDLQRQCAQIDTFITQKKDIIVVDPTSSVGVSNCINKAVDAGIPVVATGSVPEASARVLTAITPNPYENGFGAGVATAKDAGKDTPIVAAMINGVSGNSTSDSRLDGMLGGMIYQRMQDYGIAGRKEDAMLKGFNLFQELKKTGKVDAPEFKIKIVGTGDGKWTEEGGLSVAEDLLSANSSTINYVMTDNDFMGMGALKAIRNIGKKGKIKVSTAADGARLALETIKKGDMVVTGTHSGQQTGAAVIAFLDAIYHKGMDPNDLPVGSYFDVHAITKDNVDQFIDPDKDNKFYKYTLTPVKSIPEIKAELNKG